MLPSTKTAVLSSNISVFDLNETVDAICELTRSDGAHYVCVSNVHTVVLGERDASFRHVTNSAALATADGVPLIWASHFLGRAIRGRASGPDIMRVFFDEPRASGIKHFLYGSSQAVLERLEKNLGALPNGSQIVGAHAPPVRKTPRLDETATPAELQECEKINGSGADVVWVGLGAPKQEIWMYRMRPHLRPKVLIGVGAAFDFLSGNVKRAPLWMQRSGLEWLHRFSQQPSRLLWRYASTNPEFVARVALEGVRRRLKKT